MKRSRLTKEHIIGVLREQEAGATVAEVCRNHGMSSATLLRVEIEVRRDGRVRREAVEDARGGERKAQLATGRRLRVLNIIDA